MISARRSRWKRIFFSSTVKTVPLRMRWAMQSTTLAAWEITVAVAADQTPQWKPPMKSRSSRMFRMEEKIR